MKMFAELGQDSRLSIYQLVVEAGAAGLSAGKIGEHLTIAQTTLSFHLKELVHSGLVDIEQRGRNRLVEYIRGFGISPRMLVR